MKLAFSFSHFFAEFAKLCLSSGSKKKRAEEPRANLDGVRKSLEYLLTDDDSDKENNQICERLGSLTINKPEISKSERRRTSFYSTGGGSNTLSPKPDCEKDPSE